MVPLTLLLLALCSFTHAWQGCPERLNPAKVIRAMGSNNPGLRILVAHRGAHSPGCPENSRCAIDAAVRLGFEVIEIDARADKFGELWPAHDIRAGRTSDYVHNGRYFDAFHDPPLGPNNPPWSDLSGQRIRQLHFRDSRGVVSREQYAPLEVYMAYIKKRYPDLVVTLDIKSLADLDKAVLYTQRLGMHNQIVVKFPSTYMRPEHIMQHTKGIKYIPIFLGSVMDDIVSNPANVIYGKDKDMRVVLYWHDYTLRPGFVALEPPSQQFHQTRQGVVPDGPYAFVDNWFGIMKQQIGFGRYNTVQDGPTGYYDRNGHCCSPISIYYDHSHFFGDQTRDDRGNLLAVLKTSSYVLSDNTYDLMRFAKLLGFRTNLCRLTGN